MVFLKQNRFGVEAPNQEESSGSNNNSRYDVILPSREKVHFDSIFISNISGQNVVSMFLS
jgi:hypothetical protein